MVDLIVGQDVRLMGTKAPVMKVHRHVEEASHVECIWFNTLLELQTGIFNSIVLEEHKPDPSSLKGEFPE